MAVRSKSNPEFGLEGSDRFNVAWAQITGSGPGVAVDFSADFTREDPAVPGTAIAVDLSASRLRQLVVQYIGAAGVAEVRLDAQAAGVGYRLQPRESVSEPAYFTTRPLTLVSATAEDFMLVAYFDEVVA